MNTITTRQPTAALANAQYTIFHRHDQSFCIDVSHLQEVLQQSRITPVPQSHPALAGVMNLRGDVLPVLLVDLWLRLPKLPYDPDRPVLVLRRKDLLVGIQVDSVQRVGLIPNSEVLPSPLTAQSPIWAGIWFRTNQELVTLLDSGALLDAIYNQIVHHGSIEISQTTAGPKSE
jgi:purine-binding chemotaxis protein CheW